MNLDIKMDFYKISDAKLSDFEFLTGFERISPIIGATLPAKDYFEKILPLYNFSGKLLSPGEIGCTLTHIEIYKKIIDKNKPAMIFENDIEVTKELLDQAIEVCDTLDFVHLGWHPDVYANTFFYGVKSNKRLFLINHLVNFHGTYSYFITPKIAKALLAFHEKAINKADNWGDFFSQNKEFKAYFSGIFSHPKRNGDENSEIFSSRAKINQKIYYFSWPFITRKMIKNILQSISKLPVISKPIIKTENNE